MLSSLGNRVNNRRIGGSASNMRERLQQAQRRTASAFLTSDAMALASELAQLNENGSQSENSSESSESSQSSPSSSEDESEDTDADAWKEELRKLAEKQEEEEAAAAQEAEEFARQFAQQEQERERWIAEEARRIREEEKLQRQAEERAAAAAAVAAEIQAQQEKMRAEEKAREDALRKAEERRIEQERHRREYEQEEARKLAEQLRLQQEEEAKVKAEKAERRRLADEAAQRRNRGGSASRLSDTQWTPRLRLVEQYARRLQVGAEHQRLLPRVSLPPPGHKRAIRSTVGRRHQSGNGNWSWVASPRGHCKVESARENARRFIAMEETAKAQSVRQLNSSLHKFSRGPAEPIGHRYVQPPRSGASFAR